MHLDEAASANIGQILKILAQLASFSLTSDFCTYCFLNKARCGVNFRFVFVEPCENFHSSPPILLFRFCFLFMHAFLSQAYAEETLQSNIGFLFANKALAKNQCQEKLLDSQYFAESVF